MRKTTEREVRRQREVIRDVMLSAGLCATWLTLEELARLTHYPPASISAQLRHLRKPQFGAFAVMKRSRRVNPGMRGDGFGTLWEYSVGQAVPEERRTSSRSCAGRGSPQADGAPAAEARASQSGSASPDRRRRKKLARRRRNLRPRGAQKRPRAAKAAVAKN